MTYFGFLGVFLCIPLGMLLMLSYRDQRRGKTLPAHMGSWPARPVILAHVLLAVIYTTPWDNYLVASGVWWYDARLVTGIVLGWVPVEEYIFFVLQTLAMGLLVVFLAKRLPQPKPPADDPWMPKDAVMLRTVATVAASLVWLGSLGALISGEQLISVRYTYLALILAWALFPVIGQCAFGADILWRYRSLVFWSLVPATIYLGMADNLAISSGTWTIDPAQSTGIMLAHLPLEEGLFFLMTNMLLVFGIVLVLAQESQHRAPNAPTAALRGLAAVKNIHTLRALNNRVGKLCILYAFSVLSTTLS